ncbi:metal ABC transporter substrate-binding protein [Vagococcus elongatus]|uniref:Metal ABC transporter substrate-binding protein n=1 Tax=Vagococcus elongatus TaxID=180344 RepID=A0A430AMV5_9ENTE|nr:metal ABC transporter substrate-binding protein [Vagococcus elongatus]RSU09452.1 metal ABC transporter substrate-binding protein [Vagococcus elongatus]
MRRKVYICLLTIVSMFALSSCGTKKNESENASPADDHLQVVASYSVIADMVEQVGGDKVSVTSIVPRGTDPHSYEPTPEDTLAIEKADVIFYNGLNLETGKGWFDKLIENGRKEQVTFQVTEEITPEYLSEKGQETQEDPHAWLSLENGIRYVETITDYLIKVDGKNKDIYLENEEAYIKKLEELNQTAHEKLSSLPGNKKVLVTSEGAFKYFAREYGLTAEYIWEINTDTQGTPDQITRVAKIIKENDIPALFVETSVSPKTMEAVSRETGVEIFETIFTDSLAKEGTEGDNYYDMMKWNIDKISEGLSQ